MAVALQVRRCRVRTENGGNRELELLHCIGKDPTVEEWVVYARDLRKIGELC